MAFCYYGPYDIVARVGSVAYKLKLPKGSQIDPVIHISQLKKAVTLATMVSTTLPPTASVLQQVKEPEKVLESKLVQKGKAMVQKVLVQWKGLPTNMATWEELADMKRKFPTSAT